MATKGKTIMRTLKIDEIAAVDRAAQKPARAVLMKRAPEEVEALAKGKAAMTTATEGHAHVLYHTASDDVDLKVGDTSYVDGHSHPWIRDLSGNIVIGEARGHTHGIAVISKKEPSMSIKPPLTPEETTALEKRATDAETKVVRLQKVADLAPTHRAHFDGLKGEAADAFLAKSADEREQVVKGLRDADPIVFTSADGTTFRKSDDPRLVTMAKQRDADAAELRTERTARIDALLAKRAGTELGHVPGDEATKVALLKAVDTIPVEQRTKVTELLKASDAGLAKAFARAGTAGVGKGADASDPETKLETLAKALQAKSPGLTFEKAYAEVLKTDEGQTLYEESLEPADAASGD